VELKPLHEDAVGSEVLLDGAVELAREQARDAAHPRIRGLGDDDVIGVVRERKERLRVFEVDRATRIGKRARYVFAETPCSQGHRWLDLYRVEPLDVRIGQQRVARQARAEADVRYTPRRGVICERQR